jgi:hypothetical protein
MIRPVRDWLLSVPNDELRTWSLVAVLAASTIAWVDSVQLFNHILEGRVAAVPRVGGFSPNIWTVMVVLGSWAIGTVAFAVPRTRLAFGWLGPVGVVGASLLDRQVFTDITFLIVLAFAMHWWSGLLGRRTITSHLRGVPLRVLQSQISIVFFWTAIAKLNPRFLSGAVLSTSFTGPVPPPDFLLQREALVALAVATVFGEAVLAVALWVDTLRPMALTAAVGFHVLILMFFRPTLALAAFACVMGSGYLLFAAEPWRRSPRDLAEATAVQPPPGKEQVT